MSLQIFIIQCLCSCRGKWPNHLSLLFDTQPEKQQSTFYSLLSMNPLLMKGIQVLPGNHIIIDMTFFSIKINPEICLHIQNYSGKEEL